MMQVSRKLHRLRAADLQRVCTSTGAAPRGRSKKDLVAALAALPVEPLAEALARALGRRELEALCERSGHVIPRGAGRREVAARLRALFEQRPSGPGRWRPFEEAKALARRLGIRTSSQWRAYRHGDLPRLPPPPADLPVNPAMVYCGEWQGWRDFLGSRWRSYAEASALARSEGLRCQSDWEAWCLAGKRPADVPANPGRTYRGEWQGWYQFLGTPPPLGLERWRSLADASAFAQKKGLRTVRQWRAWCAAGKRPADIPARPEETYPDWEGWERFLGEPVRYGRAHR